MKMLKNVLLPALLTATLLCACEENKKPVAETILVDNKVSAVPTSFGKVKFNNAYTGFKFADTTENRYIFTKNGPADAKSKSAISYFEIQPLENFGYKEAVNLLVELSLDYRARDKVIYVSDISRASEYVNKNSAQFHRFSVGLSDNTKAEVIQGIISKRNNSILFVGYGVGVEGEDLKQKFLATYKSIDFE